MDPQTEADVLRSLGALHAKVDILLAANAGHDARITTVERRQWFISGGMSLCAALLTTKLKALFGL